MKIIDIINEEINNILYENKIWYHGTPDMREISKTNSFSPRTDTTTYIPDPKRWNEIQNEMQDARSAGNEDLYFELLDQVSDLQKSITYKKPIYFTDNHNVASTYADPHRAFDYQESIAKLLKVEINDIGKILKVPAHGEKFRMINVDFVKAALRNNGISEDKINQYFSMFPTNIRNNKMSAETIGIIAQLLGFDIVDVLGVLDSYHGGSIKSDVRMVFDPSRINIIN